MRSVRNLATVAAALAVLVVPAAAGSPTSAAPPTLAFASSRSSCGGFDVYTTATDGSDVRRITDTCLAYDPVWSPNGSRIAFTSTRDGLLSIYTMKPDGTDVRRVTPTTIGADEPSWRGDLIAFRGSGFPGTPGLWVIHPDGSGMRRLTEIGDRPALSPDASKLAYLDTRVNDVHTLSRSIRVLNTDGTGTPFIAGNGDGAVTWSPDGGRLAWVVTAGHQGGPWLVVANADGTSEHTVLADDLDYCADRLEPAWSPDGSTLAFASCNVSGQAELYTISADGGTPTRVTVNAADDVQPDWRPAVPSTGLVLAKLRFPQRACATRASTVGVTVTDAQGRPLAGAAVSIRGGATIVHAVTRADGTASLAVRASRRHKGRLSLVVSVTAPTRPTVTRNVSLPRCR